MRRSVPTTFGLMMLTLCGSVLASGVGGGLGSGVQQSQPRVIDERYEYGKAVFLGREPGTAKIKYCVEHEGEVKKLKRKTLKRFKSGSAGAFANALLVCDQPDSLALRTLKDEQIPFVLYYLNKRYKLDLRNS